MLTVRLDDDIRDFTIERVAHFVELAHPRKRIRGLQQRTMLAAARALPERVRRRVHVEHRSALRQPFPIDWTKYCSAAGRKNDVGQCGAGVDEVLRGTFGKLWYRPDLREAR